MFFEVKLSFEIQAVERVQQGLGGCAGVEQRADGHVAADSGEGVEVTDLHAAISGRIWAAGPRREMSTIGEIAVFSMLISMTRAPADLARSTRPAAG